MKNSNKEWVYAFIVMAFIGGFFLIRGITTGYIVFGDEIVSESRFVVVDLYKDEDSILETRISTSKLSTILVESEDCSKWKEGQDDDNVVMDKYENVRNIRFNIGDPSTNVLQQIDLYKASKICLVIGNLEGGENRIRVDTREGSKDRWNIVE